jgi:hypothetical protein
MLLAINPEPRNLNMSLRDKNVENNGPALQEKKIYRKKVA